MAVSQQRSHSQRGGLTFGTTITMTLLLTTSMTTAQMPAEVIYLNNRIPFPEARYRQYRWLSGSDRQKIADAGYTPEEWDQPKTAIMESIPFKDLGILQSKVSELGLTQDQWDCYVNHYAGYSWEQLSNDLQIHAVALGWTPLTWQDKTNSDAKPILFRNFWDELSGPQKKTAGEFCYFENTWNEENLRYWTTPPPSEHTPSPTKAPTMAPTITMKPTMVTLPPAASASSTPSFSIVLEIFLIVGMAVAFIVA